ncbi:MAG: formylglycine-generating enzyme family protein [Polyangiaceae bacterium]
MSSARSASSSFVSHYNSHKEAKAIALLSALIALSGCSSEVRESDAESGGAAAEGPCGAAASAVGGAGGVAGAGGTPFELGGLHRLPEGYPWKKTPVASRPSCQFLDTRCQGESCCESLEVPAGSFEMGRGDTGAPDACPADTTCDDDEQPAHWVTLSQAFWLDKYEVTVGRYRKFVDFVEQNPGWIPADMHWRADWDLSGLRPDTLACPDGPWTDEPGVNEDKPISCIDYPSAFAFCVWDGGRLPTEAEWEYAAAGGDEERLYPWGFEYQACDQSSDEDCGDQLAAVGSYPRGAARWGQMDLGGSLKELLLDTYAPYSGAAATDPLNTQEQQQFVVRGSSFAAPVARLRVAGRAHTSGHMREASIGVRCVFLP